MSDGPKNEVFENLHVSNEKVIMFISIQSETSRILISDLIVFYLLLILSME